MGVRLPRGAPRIGDTGRLAESRLARQLGGTQTPASGAVPGAKGDIRVGGFLVEAKSTVGGSLSVRHDVLLKIALEARDQARVPALAVTFTTGDGRPVRHGSWVMVSQAEFEAYREWRESHDA